MLFRSSFDIEYYHYLLWTIYICLLSFYTIFKCCFKICFLYFVCILCFVRNDEIKLWNQSVTAGWYDCALRHTIIHTHKHIYIYIYIYMYIYILKRLLCFVSMVSEDLNGLNGVDLKPILTISYSEAYYNQVIYLKVMTNWNGFPLLFCNSMIPL